MDRISNFHLGSLVLKLSGVLMDPVSDILGFMHRFAVDVQAWHCTATGVTNQLLPAMKVIVDIVIYCRLLQAGYSQGLEHDVAVRALREVVKLKFFHIHLEIKMAPQGSHFI
jgi:hypothetical protein